MAETKFKTRAETEEEKALREWFAKQALSSLDTLEAAARTILGLVTALLGTLFAVLTVASDKLPAYMQLASVRWMGVLSVCALLAALLCALNVLLPERVRVSSARPDQQEEAVDRLRKHKSRWLTAAVVAFGAGVGALGVVVIAALLAAA